MSAVASDRRHLGTKNALLRGLHIDGMLFIGIAAILLIGLAALYSAVGQNEALILNQAIRILNHRTGNITRDGNAITFTNAFDAVVGSELYDDPEGTADTGRRNRYPGFDVF